MDPQIQKLLEKNLMRIITTNYIVTNTNHEN